jgi:hypothetical protein
MLLFAEQDCHATEKLVMSNKQAGKTPQKGFSAAPTSKKRHGASRYS